MSQQLVRLSQYKEVLHLRRERNPTTTVCGINIVDDLNLHPHWRPHVPTLCKNCGRPLGRIH
jgi:hypothetical protein